MLMLALPSTIPCKLCLPCITPPCYKQEPGVSYTTNAPGDSYGGDSSSCWRQRLLTPHKVPGAGGATGELCGCPADWSEYESYGAQFAARKFSDGTTTTPLAGTRASSSSPATYPTPTATTRGGTPMAG